jgi:tripartite-type tricarboxylate transporter receptor subunit TctC
VHVPYKGGGVSVQDVVSGQVQLTFENPATVLPLIEAGSVRALAVTSETRSPTFPRFRPWWRAASPILSPYRFSAWPRSGTPANIVAKLNDAVNESLKAPGVAAALAKLSLDIRAGSPAEFALFLGQEREKWGSVARLTNIKVE